MGVIIDEVSTEMTVGAPTAGRGGGGGEAEGIEAQAEDLRAVIREILVEEIERYLRTALPR